MRRKIAVNVRYRFIESQVLDFFTLVKDIQPTLLSFPLDMVSIIQLFANYKLWSYQYYSKKFQIPIEEVVVNCQSDSGCTFYNRENNAHVIVFNQFKPKGRQQWTLAHEFGHCFLNHFDNIDYEQIAENNITAIYDKTLESEADYFASIILAPFPLYHSLNIRSGTDIQNLFGLSAQASANRYNDYSQWQNRHYKNSFDMRILNLFHDFLSTYAKNNQ